MSFIPLDPQSSLLGQVPQLMEILKTSLQGHKEHIALEVKNIVFAELQAFFSSGLDTLHKTFREAMDNLEDKVKDTFVFIEKRFTIIETWNSHTKALIDKIALQVGSLEQEVAEMRGKQTAAEGFHSKNYESFKGLEANQGKLYEWLCELKASVNVHCEPPCLLEQEGLKEIEDLRLDVDLFKKRFMLVEELEKKVLSVQHRNDSRCELMSANMCKVEGDLSTLRLRFEKVEAAFERLTFNT